MRHGRDVGELVRPADAAQLAAAVARFALDIAERHGADVRETAPLRKILTSLFGNTDARSRVNVAAKIKEPTK